MSCVALFSALALVPKISKGRSKALFSAIRLLKPDADLRIAGAIFSRDS